MRCEHVRRVQSICVLTASRCRRAPLCRRRFPARKQAYPGKAILAPTISLSCATARAYFWREPAACRSRRSNRPTRCWTGKSTRRQSQRAAHRFATHAARSVPRACWNADDNTFAATRRRLRRTHADQSPPLPPALAVLRKRCGGARLCEHSYPFSGWAYPLSCAAMPTLSAIHSYGHGQVLG